MLLKMYELQKANASTVLQSIMDFCPKLWLIGIEFEKLLLVFLWLRKKVPYMVSAVNQLKPLFPKLKHVTCFVHAFHWVYEPIRKEHDIANQFTTGLPLPNFPVITRWGSWIECAAMLYENFKKIREFVLSLDPVDAGEISKAQQLLLSEKIHILQTELYCVHSYKYLTAVIK